MGVQDRDWYQEHWKREVLGIDPVQPGYRRRPPGALWPYVLIVVLGGLSGIALHMKLGGYRISLQGFIAWLAQWT